MFCGNTIQIFLNRQTFKTSGKHPKTFQRKNFIRIFIPNIPSLFSLSVYTSPTSFLTLVILPLKEYTHISSFRWHNLKHSSYTCEVTRKLRVAIGQLVGTASRTLSTINSHLLHRVALKSLHNPCLTSCPYCQVTSATPCTYI